MSPWCRFSVTLMWLLLWRCFDIVLVASLCFLEVALASLNFPWYYLIWAPPKLLSSSSSSRVLSAINMMVETTAHAAVIWKRVGKRAASCGSIIFERSVFRKSLITLRITPSTGDVPFIVTGLFRSVIGRPKNPRLGTWITCTLLSCE